MQHNTNTANRIIPHSTQSSAIVLLISRSSALARFRPPWPFPSFVCLVLRLCSGALDTAPSGPQRPPSPAARSVLRSLYCPSVLIQMSTKGRPKATKKSPTVLRHCRRSLHRPSLTSARLGRQTTTSGLTWFPPFLFQLCIITEGGVKGTLSFDSQLTRPDRRRIHAAFFIVINAPSTSRVFLATSHGHKVISTIRICTVYLSSPLLHASYSTYHTNETTFA